MELNVRKIFEEYIQSVRDKKNKSTEPTLRTDFENLINSIKKRNILIFQEPIKTGSETGKPDFRVENCEMVIGYAETKPLDFCLDTLEQGDTKEARQFKTYVKFSDNILYTNYLEFRLYQKGVLSDCANFGKLDNTQLKETDIQKVYSILNKFLDVKPSKITDPKQLSELLADRAKYLRIILKEYLDSHHDSDYYNKLYGEKGLYNLIKGTLIDKISREEFIDAYVQTITYGIFLSKLNSIKGINKQSALKNIPESAGVIKELFKTMEVRDIPDNISWIIDQLLNIINNIETKTIKEKLSLDLIYDNKDPYVYFYENFLTKYDPSKRKAMGVYYTPLPVVDFIVNSTDNILKSDFNKKGLKDNSVICLDFATGTGTFLLEAFKKILNEVKPEQKNKFISSHLLKNFFGFEYLIAPYAVAHMKLSQFLQEEGYILSNNEHIRILLSDTLDDAHHKVWSAFPELSHEGIEALQVKNEAPLLVIMGNPPYSIHSKNNKPWIKEQLKIYKENLSEKKTSLNDDYVKFIRFAQWKIEKTGRGIVGIIVNNSFLSGITYRVMRKKLMESFDNIYIVNLHGKSDKEGDGKSVFDIKSVGVCICFLIKHSKESKNCQVYHYSCKDEKIDGRKEKFTLLKTNTTNTLEFTKLDPVSPNFWFYKYNKTNESKYYKLPSLTEIFPLCGCGVSSDRDELFVDRSHLKLEKRMKTLLSGDYDEEFKNRYEVKDSSGYPLAKRIKTNKFSEKNILEFSYRPFDNRYIYYQVGLTSRPGYDIMKHLIGKQNLALVYSRQVAEDVWNHCFITDKLADRCLISLKTKESNYYIPLKLADTQNNQQTKLNEKSEAFKITAKKYSNYNINYELLTQLKDRYNFEVHPEEIFYYVYAVLNSKHYKDKFRELLIQDVPRICFVKDAKMFKKISVLGKELTQIHLKTNSESKIKVHTNMDSTCFVNTIKYEKETKRVWINKQDYFEGISQTLWDYKIGSIKVLEKWLKDLRGIKLTTDDIDKYSRIVSALEKSLAIIKQIDNILMNEL